jgi:hypothetical protein
MTYTHERQRLDFSLEGRVFGLVFKNDDRPKRLRLLTLNGEYSFKLSKSLRQEMPSIQIGDWIGVKGEKQTDEQTGICKLKARQILLLDADAGRDGELKNGVLENLGDLYSKQKIAVEHAVGSTPVCKVDPEGAPTTSAPTPTIPPTESKMPSQSLSKLKIALVHDYLTQRDFKLR